MTSASGTAGTSVRTKALYCVAAVCTGMAMGGSVWAVSAIRKAASAVPFVSTATATLAKAADAPEAAADQSISEAGSARQIVPVPLPSLALLPPPPPPPITLELNADLHTQRLKVIENGSVKYTWPISSGRPGFDTKTGTFRPQWASRLWYSRQYELAPMPHAIFFHQGMAFHATNAVRLLGRPASHGCIRLSPANAALLYKLVHKHGYSRTKIVVHHGSRSKVPPTAMKSKVKPAVKPARREAPSTVDRRAASRVASRSGKPTTEASLRVR